GYHVASCRPCALRHDNDHEASARPKAVVNFPHHALKTVGNLGDQDDVSTSSNGGTQGNPARVASHHLQHHHPVMTLGRGHELVHSIGGHLNGGLIAECEVCRRQIIVDGLGNTDDVESFLEERLRNTLRAVAANVDH